MMTPDHQFEYLQARLLKKDHRIAALEETIRAALPDIEDAVDNLEREKQSNQYYEEYLPNCYVVDAREAIAKLKGLINE